MYCSQPLTFIKSGWKKALIGAFFLSGASYAWAHDYLALVNGEALTLHRGHFFSGHEGQEVPFKAEQIKQYLCLRDGKVTQLTHPSNYPLPLDTRCDVLRVDVDEGIWSQTWTKLVPKPPAQVDGMVLKSWHAFEAFKWGKPQALKNGPLASQGLELVVQPGQRTFSQGGKLRLIAYFNGKPQEGVKVAYKGKFRGETDEAGQINLKLRQAGVQQISASFEVKNAEGAEAGYRLYNATLQFTLPSP